MKLLVAVASAFGVSVAVQTLPPLVDVTADSAPFAMLRSVFANPSTASLKLMVTAVLIPASSVLSATTMLAEGLRVSKVTAGELPAPPALPTASV